ncbi:MAG TPA: SRPBCC family protein [Bryobacteraceae bacterium]|nr:SRPBCC family protein [Bryobacteraceae bacterium]
MKLYTLQTELTLPVSVQEAFQIFEDPYNLARITPPWLRFEITSRERVRMRRGAEITYRISWLRIPIRWRTVITEYEPPFYFVDEQAEGPYRLWRHHHELWPIEEGTVIRDRVEYALPLGLLGRLAHFLLVRRQLDGIFAYRQAALEDMIRTTATES